MNTYNKHFNINNVIFDKEIIYKDEIEYFTQIPGAYPIPTESIIYKTVTGIGATHSEIVSPRNSIIVLPNISIVTSKDKFYREEKGIQTLAIYGKIKENEIANYLLNGPDNAKILTTPNGLDKVIRIMEKIKINHPQIDYKKLFFVLIDECHKVIQDAEYRPDMRSVMDHFFKFENKAMVSATPIPPSDPRFSEGNFKHIKVSPKTREKHRVDLIHTNSLVNGLQYYLSKNKSDCYCIFFNSIVGINSLIEQLKLDDYRVYCSERSLDLQKLNGQHNTSFELDEFKRFNFFTSSFFNGLDIVIEAKPNIVILTDYGFKSHTLIDPYTDTLQIIGRFRKKFKGDIPYNKITHINNSGNFTTPISEAEAIEKVKISEFAHEQIKTLKYSLNDNTHYGLFDQALKTILPYSNLLNKEEEFSYFLFDNYLDDERVKNYYHGAAALHTAYYRTGLYDLSNDRRMFDKEEITRLKNESYRYSKKMNKKMTDYLLQLEDYKGLNIYYEQWLVIEKLSFTIFEAYKRLGYDNILNLKYSKPKIEKELLKLDIEEGKNSFPIIDLMHKHFKLNKSYTWKALKIEVQRMFDEYNINSIATAKDVERYFEFKSKKEGESRVYVFTAHKQFPVNQKKHI